MRSALAPSVLLLAGCGSHAARHEALQVHVDTGGGPDVEAPPGHVGASDLRYTIRLPA